jgi:hypothetical protein
MAITYRSVGVDNGTVDLGIETDFGRFVCCESDRKGKSAARIWGVILARKQKRRRRRTKASESESEQVAKRGSYSLGL